ncbi:MAG: hypothetical protein MUE44_15845 [Oscillatoriaceae cyanobacterium Prado104]|jgi:hypothetical protein|nr:hypothetical protein [Oscillatoriaceae cyanobacterium Prado104]
MEALQQQVAALTEQVNALYKLVEDINEKLFESAAPSKLAQQKHDLPPRSVANRTLSDRTYSGFEATWEHKDILLDDGYFDNNSQSFEKELTADIQIQRLTAQLTAAYNRIAALEEQLLAKRISS